MNETDERAVLIRPRGTGRPDPQVRPAGPASPGGRAWAGAGRPRRSVGAVPASRPVPPRRPPAPGSARRARRSGRGRIHARGCSAPRRRHAARRRTRRWPGGTTPGRPRASAADRSAPSPRAPGLVSHRTRVGVNETVGARSLGCAQSFMCSAPHDDEARLDAPAPTGLVEHRDMECIATQGVAACRTEDAGVGDEHREVAVPVDVEGWVKRVQRRNREIGDVIPVPAMKKWRGDGMGKSSLGMIGPTLKSGDEPRLAAGKGTVIHPSHTPLGTENSLRVNIDPWWKGDEAIPWASSREYGGRCGAPGPTPRTAMESRGEKSERLLVSTPSNFGGSPSGAENTWKSVGLQEGLPIGLRVIWRPSPDACSNCAPESEASAAAGAAAGATSVAAMTAMMRTDALTRRRNVMLRSPHDRVL